MIEELRVSVVIPAHNEEAVLGRCLDSLVGQDFDGLEVVVVANGCTDSTVAVAQTYQPRLPGLRVVELSELGKVGALNAGDDAASAFPRIYLDADVELAVGALSPLVQALDTEAACLASPQIFFDSTGADRVVDAFYRVFTRLPYVGQGLVGLGLYGMSMAGRARFDRFPDLIADDLFVQRLFDPSERLTTSGVFTVHTPRRTADLISVRTRVARGNAELASADEAAMGASTAGTLTALASLVVRRPWLILDALVYVAVTLAARRRAGGGGDAWRRDESSRVSVAAAPLREPDGPTTPPTIDVDGVQMTAWTQSRAVEHVMSEIQAGKGGVILTPNVDIMRQLRKDKSQTLAGSVDLIVADGMPIVWASRAQGTPLPERVTGADLVWSLSQAAADQHHGIYLLGGAPGVAERAGQALVAANAGLRLAGHAAPERGFEDDPAALEQIVDDVRASKPDLVFVAMGFPKQERLALLLAEALPQTWFLGCGGALDMAAGDVSRAGARFQAWGVEWVYRLAQEPRRLARRYLVDDIPYAVALLARAALRRVDSERRRLTSDGRS